METVEILTDALLALLAAVGIWALGRLALERLFAQSVKRQDMWIVVRVRGDGDGLEQTVRTLAHQCSGPDIVLVDCGLNGQGRALAKHLIKGEPGVSLCAWERLGPWMKEAEAWTRQENTTK